MKTPAWLHWSLRLIGWIGGAVAVGFALPAVPGGTGAAWAADEPPRTGAQVWQAACTACHGSDGAGRPRDVVGFSTPLPDLRDCTFATSEPTQDWFAVVHEGGRVRGLDALMPAFGGALSDEEIARVVDYLRGFCRDLPDWPLGELNLPRALFTEKAFPENELVLTSTIAVRGPGSLENELVYEQRLGARSMFEVGVPFAILNQAGTSPATGGAAAPAGWAAGLGDLGFAFKHALVASVRSGSILAVGLDVAVPTGRQEQGLGAGVTIFDPFVAFGQILPAGAFLQAHAGVDLPVDTSVVKRDVFGRALLGWSLSRHRFGRMYSPMIEVLGTRELDSGAVMTWDLVPQMQVTLSRRKHVRVDVGADVPVNQTQDRHVRVGAYLLWDWYEGTPFEGW